MFNSGEKNSPGFQKGILMILFLVSDSSTHEER